MRFFRNGKEIDGLSKGFLSRMYFMNLIFTRWFILKLWGSLYPVTQKIGAFYKV